MNLTEKELTELRYLIDEYTVTYFPGCSAMFDDQLWEIFLKELDERTKNVQTRR